MQMETVEKLGAAQKTTNYRERNQKMHGAKRDKKERKRTKWGLDALRGPETMLEGKVGETWGDF